MKKLLLAAAMAMTATAAMATPGFYSMPNYALACENDADHSRVILEVVPN